MVLCSGARRLVLNFTIVGTRHLNQIETYQRCSYATLPRLTPQEVSNYKYDTR